METEVLARVKEAYIYPAITDVVIVPREGVLQNISNPGGTVPPIDPNEG